MNLFFNNVDLKKLILAAFTGIIKIKINKKYSVVILVLNQNKLIIKSADKQH